MTTMTTTRETADRTATQAVEPARREVPAVLRWFEALMEARAAVKASRDVAVRTVADRDLTSVSNDRYVPVAFRRTER